MVLALLTKGGLGALQRPGFSIALAGVHLFNDRTSDMSSLILVPLSDNNRQVFLLNNSISLFFTMKWIGIRPPNQIFPEVILQCKSNRTGLQLTCKNVFMFLFLGNGAREVPINWRCFQLETIYAHSVPWPSMRFESRVINVMGLLVSENMR